MEHYTPVKTIGKGGFGSVMLARNRHTNEELVIKQIPMKGLSKAEKAEILEEVKLLRSFDHPNVIKLLQPGSTIENNELCIFMEYASGGDLESHIQAKARAGEHFAEAQVLTWLLQLVLALDYVHHQDVLHRDIKAENVFLTAKLAVKLGDFGVAKALSSSLELTSTQIGTPYTMSPEVVAGKAYNYKSDIWSLGVVVFYTLSLKHPFRATTLPLLFKAITKASCPELPDLYDRRLGDLLAQLLAKKPAYRPSTEEILASKFLLESASGQEQKKRGLQRVGSITSNASLMILPAGEGAFDGSPLDEELFVEGESESMVDRVSKEFVISIKPLKAPGGGVARRKKLFGVKLPAWKRKMLQFVNGRLLVYDRGAQSKPMLDIPVQDIEVRPYMHAKRKNLLLLHHQIGSEFLIGFPRKEIVAYVLAFVAMLKEEVEPSTGEQTNFLCVAEQLAAQPKVTLNSLRSKIGDEEYERIVLEFTADIEEIVSDAARDLQAAVALCEGGSAEEMANLSGMLWACTRRIQEHHALQRTKVGSVLDAAVEMVEYRVADALDVLKQTGSERDLLVQKLRALGLLARPALDIRLVVELPMLTVLRELRAWQLSCDLLAYGAMADVTRPHLSTMWVCGEGRWAGAWTRLTVQLNGILLTLHTNETLRDCLCDIDIRSAIVSERASCSAEPNGGWGRFTPESCFVLHSSRGGSFQTLFCSTDGEVIREYVQRIADKQFPIPKYDVLVVAFKARRHDVYMVCADPQAEEATERWLRLLSRYSELLRVHLAAVDTFGPAVMGAFEFPPKVFFGHRNTTVIRDRATAFQHYFKDVLRDFRLRRFWAQHLALGQQELAALEPGPEVLRVGAQLEVVPSELDAGEYLSRSTREPPPAPLRLFPRVLSKKRDTLADTEGWMVEQTQHLGNLEDRIINLKDRWKDWLERLPETNASQA